MNRWSRWRWSVAHRCPLCKGAGGWTDGPYDGLVSDPPWPAEYVTCTDCGGSGILPVTEEASTPCPKCGSDLVTQSTCPDGMADCFACGAVFTPIEETSG